MKNTVKCNMCSETYFDPTIEEWSTSLDKLLTVLSKELPTLKWFVGEGGYWGCPKCKTDDYLMDLQ
jgi:predicted nucleic-acid-binding Zn-ribbon protein